MASGTIWLTSDISTLQGRIDWSSYSNGTSANSSTVTASLYISRTDWYTTWGTWSYGFNVGGITQHSDWEASVSGDWVLVSTITNSNVGHNSDGTGHCYIEGYVNGPSGTSMAGHSVGGHDNVTLDTIPRYANITEFKVQRTGLENLTLKWNADSGIDWLQYKLNNGSWQNAAGNTFTINNLSPNTTYQVKIQVRRTDSGLWTESNAVSGKTKNIGKITSAPDFNLGDSVRITKTNPSSTQNIIRLETLNPTTTVVTRNNTTDDMTIVFTDEELDTIYKKIGTSNTITIRYVVDTVGNSTYHDSVDKTCTLTGNQKTGHMKLSGNWKRIKHYRNIEGQWKHCVRWIKVDGVWRRCI